MENIQDLFNSCVKALQYNVIPEIRMVSFSVDSKKTINFQIIIETKLKDDKIELLHSICSEFESEISVQFNVEFDIRMINSNVRQYEITPLKYLVYARYED